MVHFKGYFVILAQGRPGRTVLPDFSPFRVIHQAPKIDKYIWVFPYK
jgi:hypothetical protein